MRAISRRIAGKLEQDVAVRDHRLTADEPREHGGEDSGPSPQELLAASLAGQALAQQAGQQVVLVAVGRDGRCLGRDGLSHNRRHAVLETDRPNIDTPRQ